MSVQRLMTGHVRARLVLPDHLDTAAAHAAARTLPGGWALQAGAAAEDAEVQVAAGSAAVTVEKTAVLLRLPSSAATADTLAYVTYTALERARQQQRKVTVHASAMLVPGGRAVLLLGEKGAGKTSTALALARRGWTHAGDDVVVLGERNDGTMAVWPGKSAAAIRDPAHPLAPKAQRPLEPFAAGSARLSWIVRLAVHPALATASLTPATPPSVNERLRLHEMLGRYISGLPTPITIAAPAPYGPVWPLDTPDLARWRSHLITRLTACRFDYLHAPDAEAAADLLTEEADP